MSSSEKDVFEDYHSTENFTNMTFVPEFRQAFSDLFYRNMFIVLYSIIFVVCIVGNTLVLVVTAKSARMKTRTNYFLANLAVADLCVGVLCILPNLQIYLYVSWLLGKAMCKVYYFAESFSLCASVLLLAVIAVERYIAVMHPLRAKRLFTANRMHTALVLIWVIAAVYNIPLLAVFDTFSITNDAGDVIVFCNIRDDIINLRLYYTFNFILWYALPLATMCAVYTIISWTLWHSGKIFGTPRNNVANTPASTRTIPVVRDNRSTSGPSSNSSYSHSDEGGSGGTGCVGENSQRDCSREASCEACRDASEGAKSRCRCGCFDEMTDRLLLNDEDCRRCSTDPAHSPGGRSDISCQTQFMFHSNYYGSPGIWSWSSNQEHAREDGRSFRQTFLTSRLFSCSTNKQATMDKDSLRSAFQLYQLGQSKRANGTVKHTVTLIKPRRRFRSFSPSECSHHGQGSVSENSAHRSQSNLSVRVLSSRRKVVRLLILILLTFAICVLPHHVRLLMNYWNVYPESSFGMSFFPPIAFISMYLNSALNPVLYSLFSESFRRSLRECWRRPCHRGKAFVSRVIVRSCRNLW